MDVPQLKATYLYMRFKSLAPYYSAFIVVLCIYLYSEHKLKVSFHEEIQFEKGHGIFNFLQFLNFVFFYSNLKYIEK